MMQHCDLHMVAIDRQGCPWCTIEELTEEIEKWQNGSKVQADKIEALQKELEELQKEQICMCGDYLHNHTLYSGHTFVDAYHYRFECLKEENYELRTRCEAAEAERKQFAKDMLNTLAGIVCTPVEGYEEHGFGFIMSDVRSLAKRIEELEQEADQLRTRCEELEHNLNQSEDAASQVMKNEEAYKKRCEKLENELSTHKYIDSLRYDTAYAAARSEAFAECVEIILQHNTPYTLANVHSVILQCVDAIKAKGGGE